jgi:hypothetical protein
MAERGRGSVRSSLAPSFAPKAPYLTLATIKERLLHSRAHQKRTIIRQMPRPTSFDPYDG